METLTKKIEELILEDQNRIKLFKQGDISQSEWTEKAKETASTFLDLITKYFFPYKNMVPEDVYRACITLSLHQDLKA